MPKKSFSNVSLYLVTDRSMCKTKSLSETVLAAVQGGVSMVQLREKQLSDRDVLELALEIKKILLPYSVPLIINDRIDIALACNANGVHLGQHDLPYPLARKMLGPRAIIGLSIGSFEQERQARNWDVDYLAVSPLLLTPTKPELTSPWGIANLEALRKISKHKLIAIGGINQANVSSVISAGADGVAVISAIFQAPDPKEAAYDLRKQIQMTRAQMTKT